MAQFGRPNSDFLNTDGYTTQAGGTVDIYLTIDEVTLDDADYVRTIITPTSDVYVTRYTTLEDPLSSTGHIFRNRYAKSASGGAQVDATFQLRQAYVNEASQGTLIVSRVFTNISDVFATDAYTLTAGEADLITDYTNLYNRILINQV